MEGWPGEWPSPVLKVDFPVTVEAVVSLGEGADQFSCTVPGPAVYHPWARKAQAEYWSIQTVQTYVATRDTSIEMSFDHDEIATIQIPKGGRVRELAYLAEGVCLVEAGGRTGYASCPSHANPEMEKDPANLPARMLQYLKLRCQEGREGFVLVEEFDAEHGENSILDLGIPGLSAGSFAEYGTVEE